MKKCYVFCLLCFLLSAGMYGQSTSCEEANVEINIAEIIWNATPPALDSLLDGPFYSPTIPASFHVVRLDFVLSDLFVETGTEYNLDLSILKSTKPIVLVFPDKVEVVFASSPILDVDGVITGFSIFRVGPDGMGGVATCAGLMVRESSLPSLCIDISLTNRIATLEDDTVCNSADEILRECQIRVFIPTNSLPVLFGNRYAQFSKKDIHIYPNPVRSNLFVDAYGLDVKEMGLMDINGKALKYKASIRYGTDQIQINTSQLQSGIYYLNATTSEGIICKKIVIQN